MEPEDTEKADDTQSREQLHQLGMEYLLLTRCDPYYYPQGNSVDHRYQSHDQERIIEHGGQATRERWREICFRSTHNYKFSTIAVAY